MRLTAALLVLTMTLPGSAAVSALSGEPDRDVFELRPPSDTPLKCGRGRIAELVIEAPKARGTLDTERIMIRPSALQTQYLPDARWGDTVPVTLQELEQRLNEHKASHPEFPIVVRGDRGTQYQGIMDVLDVVGRVGIEKIGLATQGPK